MQHWNPTLIKKADTMRRTLILLIIAFLALVILNACSSGGSDDNTDNNHSAQYCANIGVTTCINNDDCCPAACNNSSDNDCPAGSGGPAPVFPGEGLLVDHHAALAFENIPDCWLDAAKQITLHYAHTSHGSQIISGLEYLELYVDEKYSVAVRESTTEGLPDAETPAALRIYDGNPPETYIEPHLYWDGNAGMNMTRAVANTANYDYSMWSLCGQQTTNSVETVNRYLAAMSAFENEYPSMRFILMTGHTDGEQDSDSEAGLVHRRNNDIVRDYAREHEMILFDFAEMEKYDPDGNYYANADDTCDVPVGYWCGNWCAANAERCQNLPSCAHSEGIICAQKAKAFWWMMARLAGWNGEAGHTCN
jgi:hypothetical protein